jgi:hypothetical protein
MAVPVCLDFAIRVDGVGAGGTILSKSELIQ